MKLEDIAQIRVTDIVTEGSEIVEATVENIYAHDVLQAEYRAETLLNMVASDNGETVKADRWLTVQQGDGMTKTWTIRFYTKR
jgi:hypothetical protein